MKYLLALSIILLSNVTWAQCRIVEKKVETILSVTDVDVTCDGRGTLTNFSCLFDEGFYGEVTSEILGTKSGVCHYIVLSELVDPDDEESEYRDDLDAPVTLITRSLCCRMR